MFKQMNRQSLPNVAFRRANSLSTIDVTLRSSENVAETATSNTTDGTFDDSSMKSKVLQASFRGKTSTMDRRTASLSSRSPSSSSTNNGHPTDKSMSTTMTTCAFDSVFDVSSAGHDTSPTEGSQRTNVSIDDIHPLMFNDRTNDGHTSNTSEQVVHDQQTSTGHTEQQRATEVSDDKEKIALDYDRIQPNSNINSQTIE
jgi:hypothetical protein